MAKFKPPDNEIHLTEADRLMVTGRTRDVVIALQRSILFLARYWFLIANLLAVLVLALGFLAPVFMAEGLAGAGQATYRTMAWHNHQLPQRSYFLFGQNGGFQTYSKEQLLAWGADPDNIEAFTGNPQLGYKTALNHRMIAIFTAILAGGLIWGFAGQRPKITFVWLLVFAAPMLVDGISHMISDNGDIPFRQNNEWAVWLTDSIFPITFYQGTTLGSLNWLLRNITGILFGLGLVWFLYTYLASKFNPIRAKLEPKLRRANVIK